MDTDYTCLVIGLGSMGRRRHRCLKSLGAPRVYGYDLRQDRIEKSKIDGILPIDNPSDFLRENKGTRVFICVPPDKHQSYMDLCLETHSHFFVEAGVEDEGHTRVIEKLASDSTTKGVPSCTLLFHPAIQKIKQMVQSNALGKISTLLYHSGQFLPDWHPDEPVSEYYVSNPETGAAREIVPFELTWLAKIFGDPIVLAGAHGKTITIDGAENIDDTYMGFFTMGQTLCSLTVDVVSRCPTRRLVINGASKQLRWDWDNDHIQIYDPALGKWEKIFYSKDTHEKGYSPNIPEQMYIDEVCSFLDLTRGKEDYPTDFSFDGRILSALKKLEEKNTVSLR